jgi:hypothetical protein
VILILVPACIPVVGKERRTDNSDVAFGIIFTVEFENVF